MAINKPVGDNARKGAVRKQSGQDEARRRHGVDQAQQSVRRIYGREEAAQEENRRQEVQGRAARTVSITRIAPRPPV